VSWCSKPPTIRAFPGLHLIPKHFRAGRDVEALLGGEALRLGRGERLAMNHS